MQLRKLGIQVRVDVLLSIVVLLALVDDANQEGDVLSDGVRPPNDVRVAEVDEAGNAELLGRVVHGVGALLAAVVVVELR